MRSRSLGIAVAAGALGLTAITPALAHAPVKQRTPAPGSTVSKVTTVKVRFGESVVTGLIHVTRNGTGVTPRSMGLNRKNHAILQATFSKPLARGGYQVDWRARADDGHSESGSWRFTVR
jgi:methionine-rich copper-binding protein CopC